MMNSLVYFIQAGDFIKIGVTTNLKNRLQAIQTSCPFVPEVLCAVRGDIVQEQQLHARFSSLRVNGEWFRDDARIRDFIVGLDDESGQHIEPKSTAVDFVTDMHIVTPHADSIDDPDKCLEITLDNWFGEGVSTQRRLLDLVNDNRRGCISVFWETRDDGDRHRKSLRLDTSTILSTVYECGVSFNQINLRAFVSDFSRPADICVYYASYSKAYLESHPWRAYLPYRIQALADHSYCGRDQVQRFAPWQPSPEDAD